MHNHKLDALKRRMMYFYHTVGRMVLSLRLYAYCRPLSAAFIYFPQVPL